MTKLLLSTILLFVLAAGSSANYDTAIAAYEKGDYAAAIETFRGLAEEGDPRAQCILGLAYAYGEGVPQDHAEAGRWYWKSAEQGYAEAQYNLGVAYTFGEGVLQDYAMAVEWFRKAAVQGVPEAQQALGYMYSAGRGVEKNPVYAYAWFHVAAEAGNQAAQQDRDIAARDLTPTRRHEAEQLSQELLKNYAIK